MTAGALVAIGALVALLWLVLTSCRGPVQASGRGSRVAGGPSGKSVEHRTRERLAAATVGVALLAPTLAGCRVADHSVDPSVAPPPGTAQSHATDAATDPTSGLAWINESALPDQAKHTLAEIRAGGPYDYPRHDGVVYHNNNGVLPHQRDGYYHEFTVRTPGVSSRGAQRIIQGKGGELYYTADHYSTFERIRENR